MSVSWGGSTYPNPTTIEEREDFAGGAFLVASGALIVDVITSKMRVNLVWQGLSRADADSIYAKAITHSSAALNTSGAGGANYGNVIPIPNTARLAAVPTYPVTYAVTVEVRTE